MYCPWRPESCRSLTSLAYCFVVEFWGLVRGCILVMMVPTHSLTRRRLNVPERIPKNQPKGPSKGQKHGPMKLSRKTWPEAQGMLHRVHSKGKMFFLLQGANKNYSVKKFSRTKNWKSLSDTKPCPIFSNIIFRQIWIG